MDGKLAAEALDGSPWSRRVLRDVNREARCFRLYNDYLPCQKKVTDSTRDLKHGRMDRGERGRG